MMKRRICDRCGKPFVGAYKEQLCQSCLADLGWRCTPITNADRIRAVSDSDEELAKCIYEIGFDCHLCSEHERLSDNPLLRHEKCDEKCVEHCLEWLQRPAEVE